jgi:hypothetical protein
MQTDLLLKRLKTFEFLRGLEHETLYELAKSATWKVYSPDAVIFWEGISKAIYSISSTAG